MVKITTMVNIVCPRLPDDQVILWQFVDRTRSAGFFINCSCPDQLRNCHKICRFLLTLAYNTHMSTISEFYSGLLEKGYTEREINESCKRHQHRVAPDWFNGTYAEYLDHMHDYLNGL